MSDEAPLGDRVPGLTKRASEIDMAIGARLKALRLAADMSQSTLGEAIGVTFQQIQKYERGKNRIAASTLQILAVALRVRTGSFFDDELSSPVGGLADITTVLRGAAGVQRISDPKVQKQLMALIAVLADEPDA